MGVDHLRVARACMEGPVLQKELVRRLPLSPNKLSLAQQDLVRLGFLKCTDLGSGNELAVNPFRKEALKVFLRQYQFLGKAFFVRPHSLVFRGYFVKDINISNLISVLSRAQDFRHVVSKMKNNVQHILITPHGQLIFNEKSTGRHIVRCLIDGFVLPLQEEQIPLIEEYIITETTERFMHIQKLVEEALGGKMIFQQVHSLEPLHIGVVLKEDIYKTLELQAAIRKAELDVDRSVRGCSEIEAKGSLSEAAARISDILLEIANRAGKITYS